ncbi:SDR family NAD(P)-dependent oxidoreductase [Jatrophihabitans fulvus]
MTTPIADLFDVSGKRVIVTGASRGIGRALAVAFAHRGAHVLGVARSEDGLAKTGELAEGGSGRYEHLATDLRAPESVEAAVASAAERLDGIDVLINNAADDHDSAIEKTDLEVYQRVQDLNVRSVWVALKAASPFLKDGGGSVINIASVLGLVGIRDDSAYIAAKHALVGVTRAIALEWARKGVRVNALAPGYVDTAMLGDISADQDLAAYAKQTTPMNRWSQPEEYAGPAIFLASEASAFMTGQVLVVDGGYTAQ